MLSRSFAYHIRGVVRALVIDDIDVQWAGIILFEQGLNWLSDDIGLVAGGNDDGYAGLHPPFAEIANLADPSNVPEISSRCDQADPYDAGKRGDGERDHSFASG